MTALHASDLLTTVSLAFDCLALAWLWRNRDWLIGRPSPSSGRKLDAMVHQDLKPALRTNIVGQGEGAFQSLQLFSVLGRLPRAKKSVNVRF